MSTIFQVNNQQQIAKVIADTLLTDVNNELQRRVNLHRDSFYMFWYSKDATPQEICDMMGPNAALFFAVAAANVAHIAQVSQLAGKSLGDFLTPEQYTPPHEVIINTNGTVTIGT